MTDTSILLRGGQIYAGAGVAPCAGGAGVATALMITGSRISWVGPADAADQAGPADRSIDLGGASVLPGFVDAHVHCTAAGLVLTGLDLSGTNSVQECLDRITAFGRQHPKGVLWGHGWDETTWPERRAPSRAEVDAAVGDRLAYLGRVDVHSALVSSPLAALVDSDLDGWHPELPLSRAANRMANTIPRLRLPDAQRAAAQRAFLERCAANGIIEVHECADNETVGLADLAGLLALDGPVAVLGYLAALVSDPDEARQWIADTGAHALGGDLSVDGAVGSRTAALTAPYLCLPETCGARYLSDRQIADHLFACAGAGVQPGFHAIGDDAVGAVAAGLRSAARRLGEGGAARLAAVAPRIEHAEMPTQQDIETFAGHGAIASVQPLFDAFWGGSEALYAQRLGNGRAALMNPFAAFAEAGVALALGSDAPVTPAHPLAAIRAAMRHRTARSGISLAAAIQAHTSGGHRAARSSHPGRIIPGAPADLAIVSGAIAAIADPSAPLPVPLATIRRGQSTFGDIFEPR